LNWVTERVYEWYDAEVAWEGQHARQPTATKMWLSTIYHYDISHVKQSLMRYLTRYLPCATSAILSLQDAATVLTIQQPGHLGLLRWLRERCSHIVKIKPIWIEQ
jgi:hypothetical protein